MRFVLFLSMKHERKCCVSLMNASRIAYANSLRPAAIETIKPKQEGFAFWTAESAFARITVAGGRTTYPAHRRFWNISKSPLNLESQSRSNSPALWVWTAKSNGIHKNHSTKQLEAWTIIFILIFNGNESHKLLKSKGDSTQKAGHAAAPKNLMNRALLVSSPCHFRPTASIKSSTEFIGWKYDPETRSQWMKFGEIG